MNTRAWEAMNILRDYGFHVPDDIVDNLYRVLKTKEIVGKDESYPDQVYAVMQNETEYIAGRFPGDAVLFKLSQAYPMVAMLVLSISLI